MYSINCIFYSDSIKSESEDSEMDDRGGLSFVLGMFVGAVVGAAAAILVTPQAGDETREQIRKGAGRIRERLEKYGRDFREDAEDFVERGQRYMDEKYREVKAALAKKNRVDENSECEDEADVNEEE